jgi:hypothetical protein
MDDRHRKTFGVYYLKRWRQRTIFGAHFDPFSSPNPRKLLFEATFRSSDLRGGCLSTHVLREPSVACLFTCLQIRQRGFVRPCLTARTQLPCC